MSGPGDRAPKYGDTRQPTPLVRAEGDGADPRKADLGQPQPPGSEKNSARSYQPAAREPGDLGDASPAMVGGRQRWEEENSNANAQVSEKSDEVVVPEKLAKTRVTPVEPVEERTEAKRKSTARNASPTQGGKDAPTYLQWIGRRAKEKPEERFTNLLSHIRVPLLREAYLRLRKEAASGVDGVTWDEYGERLDERLVDLQDRIHRGSYHPQPVRRVHIPKRGGGTRPLGIPVLEDKIAQQAVRLLLEPIYEAMFIGFSYGYRLGRSQHDALDAVAVMMDRKVNWVLDADIRSFFDTIDHGWMQKFVEHRIGDKRLVRLLMKWLHAGVMEEGKLHEVEQGTPQGGNISPLLANIYLHYVLDLWICNWRKKRAHGEVYFVRYADDLVMGLELEQDAHAVREAIASRLAKFGLELHEDKTRILEFGRNARANREQRGLPKPSTFDFLGFTHICGVNQRGKFVLGRRTSRKKRRAKLASLKKEVERRRHRPVPEQHKWLIQVLHGHYRYYAVPTNADALAQFREAVKRMWHRSLQRRSQRARWTRSRQKLFDSTFMLPRPRILHPWPSQRFLAR